MDPLTRLGIAEFRYLAAAVDCVVLIYAQDLSIPIRDALPLTRYGLPSDSREIGSTFQQCVAPDIEPRITGKELP